MRGKFLFLFICLESLCFAQQRDSTYYYFNRSTPVELLNRKIKSTTNNSMADFYKLIYYSKLRDQDSMIIYISKTERNKSLPSYLSPKTHYFKAYYYSIISNDSLSFLYHTKALESGLKIKDSLTVLMALSGLSQSYDYDSKKLYNLEYLNELESKSIEYNNNSSKIKYHYLKGNYHLFREENEKAIEQYELLQKLKFEVQDSLLLMNSYGNIGIIYEENLEIPDSAIYYYQKKLDLIKSNKSFRYPANYISIYNNIGNSYLSLNSFEMAEYYYLTADSITLNENINYYKYLIKDNLSLLYAKQNKFKSAYTKLLESNQYLDSLNQNEQQIAVANIKEKYDNEKLRGDNLESEAKRKQNRNLFFGSLALLLFGGITTTLFLKNSKKKRLLAEQQQEIEHQKVGTLLKEQEINSINAMIEGQEKERKRIAEDLHDDIGSVLTTLKLHFENFKINKEKQIVPQEELINKTESLLDEAYNKVRSMAHAKNSGVIANQGLLVAIQQMAETISSANKISIDVIDHELENRLENSLELSIFRIVQELVANCIKHSHANEINIHLTNHGELLNIMVEDNGKGFDTKKVSKKNGMGLHSIEKRVEHLEGTFIIESEINKGTSVIIDIPL